MEDVVGEEFRLLLDESFIALRVEDTERCFTKLVKFIPTEHAVSVCVDHLKEKIYFLAEVIGRKKTDTLQEIIYGHFIFKIIVFVNSTINDSVDNILVLHLKLGNARFKHGKFDAIEILLEIFVSDLVSLEGLEP